MKLQPLLPSESWANVDILLIPYIQSHVASVHLSTAKTWDYREADDGDSLNT